MRLMDLRKRSLVLYSGETEARVLSSYVLQNAFVSLKPSLKIARVDSIW